jgi:Right handed beta helix region
MVPAGTYLIDNSSGPLLATNFNGQLTFQSGAEIVCTDNELSCLFFEGGTGARISGLQANYQTPPAYRNSPNEQIKFSDTTNTTLTNTTVRNSPAAGILFYNAVNPVVNTATVIDSLADGLNFSNCQNAQVTNLTTQNTGDDGLAFLNYEQYPNKTGGLAQNITVIHSATRGITIVGQSNVTVNGFIINGTAASGVLVFQDTTYQTRIPANDIVENGTITNGGAPTGPGNRYGIEYNAQASVTFANITVNNPGTTGLGGASPSGRVTVTNVNVDSVPNGGGFIFQQTASVQISGSSATDVASYGFGFFASPKVSAQNLSAINVSQTDPLKRAFWFERGQSVSASTLTVSSAAGDANVVGCYDSGTTTAGSVKGIPTQITGDTLSIQSNCAALSMRP